MTDPVDPRKENPMSSYLWIVAFIVAWIVLQTWVLPKLGVPT